MGRAVGISPRNESGPGRHRSDSASAEHKSEKVMLVGGACKGVGMMRGGGDYKSKLNQKTACHCNAIWSLCTCILAHIAWKPFSGVVPMRCC